MNSIQYHNTSKSASDSESNSIPVKETESRVVRRGSSSRNVPRIVRDELEDRYLTVQDQNIGLKKQLRLQEEKIKHMGVKLVKLVGEKHKTATTTGKERHDLFMLDDQKDRIVELEGQVNMLRERLLVTKVASQHGISKVVIPGVNKLAKSKPLKPRITPTKNPKPLLARSVPKSETGIMAKDQVTELLLEAKGENHALRDQVKRLREELHHLDKEIMSCKEQFELKEIEHEEELIALRYQVETDMELKKQKLADNMKLIRLQRDSKRTNNWLKTYETQCKNLESELNSANGTIHQLEVQWETNQLELREQQTKNLNLMKQAEEAATAVSKMKEIEAQLKALQDDNKILFEANESLVAKAFESRNRVKDVEAPNESLLQQITRLEETIRTELGAKSELLSALNQERSRCAGFEAGISALNLKYDELASALKEAELKLVVQEAFSKLPAECAQCLKSETELNQSKWELVSVRDELNKTKHLLKTQININKEYQKEIDMLSTKLEKAEVFHHDKLTDFMKVLEQRTEQMTVLEKNLETISIRSVTPAADAPAVIVLEPKTSRSCQTCFTETKATDSPPFFIRSESPNGRVPETRGQEARETLAHSPIRPLSQRSGQGQEQFIEPEEAESSPEPTLEIYIERFETFDNALLKGLFVTWEFETFERKYSPVVSNGIFHTMSSHPFRDKRFPIDGIEIQIHQAVGPSDCITLASGCLHIGSNLSTPMNTASTSENKLLGHLHYSCIVEHFDGENNNIYEQRKYPNTDRGAQITDPAPKPIPRKKTEPEISTTITDKQSASSSPPQFPSSSPQNQGKSPKKSILKNDTTTGNLGYSPDAGKSPKKRVTVNEQFLEENLVSLIESRPELENDSGRRHHLDLIRSEDQSESIGHSASTISKRRQRNSAQKSRLESEDPDEDDTDSETSKNITDLESSLSEPLTDLTLSAANNPSPKGVIRIEISYVIFNSTNRFWSDSRIKRFFVEYRFLSYPPEQLESPNSVAKPQPGKRAQFNFVQVFVIDGREKCKMLRQMISRRQKIKFTLVSEPNENDTADCEDIGYGYACLNDILRDESDLTDEEIPLYDAENSKIPIGVMSISVSALDVLRVLVV